MDKATALEHLIGGLEFWALIFGVIVVLGVAGESFFGIRIWWNSRKLQEAQRSANEALVAEIARLSAESSSHQLEIAKAQQRAAEANERAAEANEKAEHERLERMKIEEKLRPRHMSRERQAAISAKLIAFGSIEKAAIFCTNRDAEVVRFAQEIDAVLAAAGWQSSIGTANPTGRIILGVAVTTTPSHEAAARTLTNALRDEGVSAGGPYPINLVGFWEGDTSAPLHILVGEKA